TRRTDPTENEQDSWKHLQGEDEKQGNSTVFFSLLHWSLLF
ncbi:UNVERIFIED_CONTAM: hypothetical protein ABIC26_000001, partial [Paenibacillus sp. PvR008]